MDLINFREILTSIFNKKQVGEIDHKKSLKRIVKECSKIDRSLQPEQIQRKFEKWLKK
jgi:hypothetical protein